MEGKDVCLAIAAYFKRNGITYEEAGRLLGQSKQTVYNRLSQKKFFGEVAANRWAKAFSFNKSFLMTGSGRLTDKVKWSFTDFIADSDVVPLILDYLFLYAGVDIRQMWVHLQKGEFDEYRALEAKVLERLGLPHMRIPESLIERLRRLQEGDDAF